MIAFLRNLVFEDFWLKLFSLTLAVLIWLTVTFASQKEGGAGTRVLSHVPVAVLASAEDVHNFRVSPNEVAVTLQGNPRTLQTLRTNDVRAVVDLTGVTTAGDLHKRIDVFVPSGVAYVGVAPAEVQVIFPPER